MDAWLLEESSLSALVANVEAAVVVAVAGFALLMTGVSLYSYKRLRSARPLLIATAFFAFAGKGVWLVVRSLSSRGAEDWILTVAVADLVILLLMYLAIKKR